MDEQLLETWNIHNRINLYLLDNLLPAALSSKLASKGRTVGEVFAHIHNNRLAWLEPSAPDLLEGLAKIENDAAENAQVLRQSLEKSGQAVEALLKRTLRVGGKVKGFKPHATAFVGYLISHESYHRGEIGIIVAHAGYPLDRKIAYGMWEWGVR